MSHRPRSAGHVRAATLGGHVRRGPRGWLSLSARFASEGGCPVPVETGTNEHPARLRVGVIGPGRAGTALARALARAGHVITAASAVSAASRQRAHENF